METLLYIALILATTGFTASTVIFINLLFSKKNKLI